ncbi:MAG: hypothetical protein KBT30_02090 [Clostridiales bacterium]|nr:hypothetical protein [Candidatus Apopatousia equi]
MIEILNSIVEFVKNAGSFLGVDLISIIALGVLILAIVISMIISANSIEVKTNSKVKQINGYLIKNPFITDENIVEFNRIMKNKIPRAMRYQWQRYMVNRTDRPSNYLSEDNCITKPFRTSHFVQALKQIKYIASIIAIVSFIFVLGAIYDKLDNLPSILLRASVIPFAVVVITVLFLMFMNARRNSVLSDLFFNFDSMQHSLDRAVTTFPEFVDYEILFTRKEIAAGIPALQEYLQQRALYEQEQLERARLSQVEHEKYDFSKLGVKGNMIMDRAMKECEFYLGNRKILLADIDTLQTQKDLLTKSFDENNRINQRKLRDIKENIDRLREKLNTTTNKIISNDIIKQQADEVKKQQQIEKEIEDDINNYNQDVEKLDVQIQKKRDEIEANRKEVERVLTSDFKDYSDKIYEELKNIAESEINNELNTLKDEKVNLEKELEEREQYIAERNIVGSKTASELEVELNQKIHDIEIKNQEIIGANKEIESRNAEIASLRNEVDKLKHEKHKEIYRYFDSKGKEFFYDKKNNPYFYDKEGKVVYYSDLEKAENLKDYNNDVNLSNSTDNKLAESNEAQNTVEESKKENEKVASENKEVIEPIQDVKPEETVIEKLEKEPKPEKSTESVEPKAEELKEKSQEAKKDTVDNLSAFEGLEESTKKETKKVEPMVEEPAKKVEKPKAEKPKVEKKPEPKPVKVEDNKPSKKPMKKKGPAFAIRKAPTIDGDNIGFDLSAFDALVEKEKKGSKK